MCSKKSEKKPTITTHKLCSFIHVKRSMTVSIAAATAVAMGGQHMPQHMVKWLSSRSCSRRYQLGRDPKIDAYIINIYQFLLDF